MHEPACHFRINCDFTDGRSLEFVPTAVRPLGLSELTALSLDADALITLQCLTEDPKIDRSIIRGTGKMDGRLRFSESNSRLDVEFLTLDAEVGPGFAEVDRQAVLL